MLFLRVLLACLTLAALSGATCGAGHVDELPPAHSTNKQVLGPGDVVEVRIYNEADLSGTHQISPNGTIRLPLVGEVVASGLTADELTVKIQDAYNEKYLKNAEVSLLLKEYNSRKVFVLGQVAKPGPYPFDGKMTVIEAIAMAGGTTKIADGNRVLLTREKDGGAQVRVVIEVARIERGQAPDVELAPGDILFVPESPI